MDNPKYYLGSPPPAHAPTKVVRSNYVDKGASSTTLFSTPEALLPVNYSVDIIIATVLLDSLSLSNQSCFPENEAIPVAEDDNSDSGWEPVDRRSREGSLLYPRFSPWQTTLKATKTMNTTWTLEMLLPSMH